MKTGELGKTYQDGEVIIRQGEPGERMYVVQSGKVAVTSLVNGREIHITDLKAGDIFGEMALFEQEARSATVRAVGEARLITVDRKGFFRRVNEDPSLAYRILQQMSGRLRRMNADLSQLKREVRLVLKERRSFQERRSRNERRTVERRRSAGRAVLSERRRQADQRTQRTRRAQGERRKQYYLVTES